MKTIITQHRSAPGILMRIGVVLSLLVLSSAQATVIYVKSDAPGNQSGTNWANAFHDVSGALALADGTNAVEIWVAQGTYDTTASSLILRNATGLYGGFLGTETNLNQRNWLANKTSLTNSANYVVSKTGALDSSARLDGFYIENHNATASSRAISCSSGANATIANCVFRNNSTAIDLFSSSLSIQNCLFENNGRTAAPVTNAYGGIAIFSTGSAAVDHCIFRGNYGSSATALEFYTGSTGGSILNCLFTGNYSSGGPAVDCSSGTVVIRNSTVAGNRSSQATQGGIANFSTLQIFNSIIWSNGIAERNQIYQGAGTVTMSNSCLQFLNSAVFQNQNNVSADPSFISPLASADAPTTNGNFHLTTCSTLINIGNNAFAGPITLDLDGNPRFFGLVDLGVYEMQSPPLLVVPPADQVGNSYVAVQFAVAANNTNVTYQWQVNSGGGFTNLVEDARDVGVTNSALLVTNAIPTLNSNLYRCRVTGSGCFVDSLSAKYTYQSVISSPANGSANAPTDSNIAINFGNPLAAGTVSASTLAVHAMQTGRLLGSAFTNITMNGSVVTLDPAGHFKAGERVFVSATTNLQYLNGGNVSPLVWEFLTAAGTNSPGTFFETKQILGNAVLNDAAAGDLNGDGVVDVFLAGEGGNQAWLGRGDGTFVAGPPFGTGTNLNVVLGDLDSDGHLDAVVVNSAGTAEIWLNNGSGIFTKTAQSIGANVRAAVVGDFNGDGHLDLALACNGPNQVWFNDGSATFTNSGQSLGNENTAAINTADLDGNAALDLIFGNSGQASQVWLNNGSGTFTNSGVTLGTYDVRKVLAGDLDGNHTMDIVLINGDIGAATLFNNGKAVFSQPTVLGDVTVPGDPISVSPFTQSDFDLNNLWPKAIDDDLSTKWHHYNTPQVTITPSRGSTIVKKLALISAADTDNPDPNFTIFWGVNTDNSTVQLRAANVSFSARNQRLELTITNSTSYPKYRVQLSNSTFGHFQIGELELIGDLPTQLDSAARGGALADVNGDGKLDLCISRADGTSQIYTNGGAGNFSMFGTNVSTGAGAIAPADLNGNGTIDFVQVRGGTNAGAIVRLNGVEGRITGVSRDAADIVLTFSGVPGGNYVLQYTTNLPATNWTAVGTVTETSPGTFYFRDVAPADQNRFYRMALP